MRIRDGLTDQSPGVHRTSSLGGIPPSDLYLIGMRTISVMGNSGIIPPPLALHFGGQLAVLIYAVRVARVILLQQTHTDGIGIYGVVKYAQEGFGTERIAIGGNVDVN
jgi:hypothetical protein